MGFHPGVSWVLSGLTRSTCDHPPLAVALPSRHIQYIISRLGCQPIFEKFLKKILAPIFSSEQRIEGGQMTFKPHWRAQLSRHSIATRLVVNPAMERFSEEPSSRTITYHHLACFSTVTVLMSLSSFPVVFRGSIWFSRSGQDFLPTHTIYHIPV